MPMNWRPDWESVKETCKDTMSGIHGIARGTSRFIGRSVYTIAILSCLVTVFLVYRIEKKFERFEYDSMRVMAEHSAIGDIRERAQLSGTGKRRESQAGTRVVRRVSEVKFPKASRILWARLHRAMERLPAWLSSMIMFAVGGCTLLFVSAMYGRQLRVAPRRVQGQGDTDCLPSGRIQTGRGGKTTNGWNTSWTKGPTVEGDRELRVGSIS